MPQTVDLTKVTLDVKSLFWMSIAFSAVLVAFGAGKFGASKVKELMKAASKGVVEGVEEF